MRSPIITEVVAMNPRNPHVRERPTCSMKSAQVSWRMPVLIIACFLVSACAAEVSPKDAGTGEATKPAWAAATAKSLEWYRSARFGLFLHWGLYSVAAGSWNGRQVSYIGEWIQHSEQIPNEQYQRLAAGFTGLAFDAKAWAVAARRAGMRYVVLTAKHHEGFALWHSQYDNFNVVEATPFGRDVVAELAAACRAEGLRIGLYYSQCVDWHEPHGGNLPKDVKNPTRAKGKGRTWGNDWDFPPGTPHGFDAYLRRKVEPQLTELLTNYGDIALIWFDTPTPGLKQEQAIRLRDLVKRLQPGCLVSGRIGRGCQDFDNLADNEVPKTLRSRLAESCITLNDTWGYKAHDQAWKSPEQVLSILLNCTSRDVNMLLNIGPTAEGRLPALSLDCLEAVGSWMNRHGAAIHGARPAGLGLEPPWGWITLSGNAAHLLIKDTGTTTIDITLPAPIQTVLGITDSANRDVSWRRITTPSGDLLACSVAAEAPGLPRHVILNCSAPPTWSTFEEWPTAPTATPESPPVGPEE
jgi:alpha-L-fucosidase